MAITPNEEFIEKNYNQTVHLLDDFGLEPVRKLIENYATEYAVAPASTDAAYHYAFPGGLCYYNLCVLQYIGRFASAAGKDLFTKASLLKVSILHDIGKVGEPDKPYYIPTTERWKWERGIYYDFSPDIQKIKIPQRSLYLAQEHSIPLSRDEYMAILLADGQLDETNRFYKYKEPPLATILHFAVYWARLDAKNKEVNWNPDAK